MGFMRRPKVVNERRAVEHALAEGVKVRSKRNYRQLPNEYNDRQQHCDRCWKSNRRTKWK